MGYSDMGSFWQFGMSIWISGDSSLFRTGIVRFPFTWMEKYFWKGIRRVMLGLLLIGACGLLAEI